MIDDSTDASVVGGGSLTFSGGSRTQFARPASGSFGSGGSVRRTASSYRRSGGGSAAVAASAISSSTVLLIVGLVVVVYLVEKGDI